MFNASCCPFTQVSRCTSGKVKLASIQNGPIHYIHDCFSAWIIHYSPLEPLEDSATLSPGLPVVMTADGLRLWMQLWPTGQQLSRLIASYQSRVMCQTGPIAALATRHFAPSHLDDCTLKDTEQQLPLVSRRRAVSFSTLWDGDDAQARTAWTGWKTDELISVNLKLHLLMQFNAWVLPCWFVGAWMQVMEVCMTLVLSWHCQQPCAEHNPLVFSLSYPLSVLLILNVLSPSLLFSLLLPFNSLSASL